MDRSILTRKRRAARGFPVRGRTRGAGLRAIAGGAWLALAAALSAAAPAAARAADGAVVFRQVCIACHQEGAVGAPGLAPALVGSLASRADAAPVRAYMAQVLVHGLSGRIVVDGVTYTGAMPAQAALSDDEIAAVLTHVVVDLAGQKAVPPFQASDIAAARAAKPSAKDLRAQREAALAH